MKMFHCVSVHVSSFVSLYICVNVFMQHVFHTFISHLIVLDCSTTLLVYCMWSKSFNLRNTSLHFVKFDQFYVFIYYAHFVSYNLTCE